MTFSKVRIRFYLGYFFLKFPLIHSFLCHVLMMLIVCRTYFILFQCLWDDSAQIKVCGKAFFHSRYITIITSNIFNELQASAMAFIFINSSITHLLAFVTSIRCNCRCRRCFWREQYFECSLHKSKGELWLINYNCFYYLYLESTSILPLKHLD